MVLSGFYASPLMCYKKENKRKVYMQKKTNSTTKKGDMSCSGEENPLIFKYGFLSICALEIGFIIWRFLISPTRNSETFLLTFVIVIAISLPPGFGLALNIFTKKELSFYFTFGLCIGYGLIGGVWVLMIRLCCPLEPYIYIGVVLLIAGCLLFRKWGKIQTLFKQNSLSNCLINLLPPLAVLLFAFIVLSMVWMNSSVMTDVDCQSDSYSSLMILKEGRYPFVSPFLDETKLRLNIGPLFHTLTAVITKLKNGVLIKEVMAVAIISGSFFCMAIYFLANFLVKNRYMLFLAGILTLSRAYLSFFNDGNLTENVAFYYAVLFIVFLIYTMENEKILFAVLAGICLSLCMCSHPRVFIHNFPAFSLFFITCVVSSDKKLKKTYRSLLITMGIVLVLVIPQLLRLKNEELPASLYRNDATTLIGSIPYWNGYLIPVLALVGIIQIARKRNYVNIYVWSYFLMVLVFVEYWRVYQIFSPSWFELKKLTTPIFGSHYSYESFLSYPENWMSAWHAGVIIWPIAVVFAVNYMYHIFYCNVKLQVLKNFAIIFFVILVFLLIGYEFKNAKRYPEFILQSDYSALEWIRKNTSYEDTFLFSPFDNADENAVPNYVTSFWVPIVSERKSLPFRNYDIPGQFKFLNMDEPITGKVGQLQKAAYSIGDSQSYNIFKDLRITHIFVSGFLSGKLFNTYQNSPYVELIYYNTQPNSGTAMVYKLK